MMTRDYGPNADGVTDYDDTDYGPNADGVTDYVEPAPAPSPVPALRPETAATGILTMMTADPIMIWRRPTGTPIMTMADPTTDDGGSDYDD